LEAVDGNNDVSASFPCIVIVPGAIPPIFDPVGNSISPSLEAEIVAIAPLFGAVM
jgi:hypothetical protein